ncbi:hypothetical protein C8J57DRAFT_1636840 [Mycena rebaudengoi]|nr:hypothetical protein C8J57DRAFT_1636840 [Mycena rebaudengoi]
MSPFVHGVVDTQNPSYIVYLRLDTVTLTEDEADLEAISIHYLNDPAGPSGSNQPLRPQKEVKLDPELAAIAKTDSLFYTDDSDIEEGSVSSFHGVTGHLSGGTLPSLPALRLLEFRVTELAVSHVNGAVRQLRPRHPAHGPHAPPRPPALRLCTNTALRAEWPFDSTPPSFSILLFVRPYLVSDARDLFFWSGGAGVVCVRENGAEEHEAGTPNPCTTVSMSTSSALSTNPSASVATWHPSSMPTSASSATTSAFPAPPLLYSDDVFYAASTAALDHFNEYGNLGEPSCKHSFDNILNAMASPLRQIARNPWKRCKTN